MSTPRDEPGRVGPFDLGRQVASSPTGAVWQGYDPALNRAVALKRVADQAVHSVESLRQEARLLAALPHPNIVRVIDLIETSGLLWLVEEWIDGVALPSVIEKVGRLTAEQAVGVVRGALLGLGFAHQRGVVHGDISPSNMLLARDGTTKLIDFGLARPTGTPGVSGTPGYLSPEAARGLPLLPASDVFSAAAVLAYLLRGRPLFEGPTVEAVLAAQVRTAHPDLRGIDTAMGAVLRWGLAPEVSVRPADAGTFLAALDDAANRSFGTGWLATAGLAGAVAATMTATLAAPAGAPTAALPLTAPTHPLAASSGTAAAQTPTATGAQTTALATPGAVKAGASKSVLRTVLAAIKSHALAAAAAVTVVGTASVVLLVVANHKSAPNAAPPRFGVSPSPFATPISFNLSSFDWRNATVPGDSCFDHNAITLHEGTATLNVPAPPGGIASGFVLRLTAPPAVGVLASGPQVAILSLECMGTGGYAGTGTFWFSYVVFDAQGGAPHLLGIFGDPGVAFGNHGVIVRNGVIDVAYSEYGPSDPHCCPSGPARTATISYDAGTLVASWPHSSPYTKPGANGARATQVNASGSTPPTTAGPSAPASGLSGFPRAVRLRTWSETSGPAGTIPATLDAQDRITDCATHSYGTVMISYFRRHACQSATRRLYTIRYHGRQVALSWITLAPDPGQSPLDGVDNAGTFTRLENAPNTGSIDDLLREGDRPAGWPAQIPPDETFSVGGHGGLVDTVEVFDAWYLDGRNTSQDPALLALIRSLYFTS